jgi:uroporphyrin-III C-methyltransferase
VVVIENCSRPDQRILRLTLADLAHGLDTAHGPVLVMIGEALQRRVHQAAD